jgi:hypothetical protein
MTVQFVILILAYIALIAFVSNAVRHFTPRSDTPLELERQ